MGISSRKTVLDYSEKMITPVEAQHILDHFNKENRTISMARARQYANDMVSGNWQAYNGECVKFYENGLLADGQHTLTAVVISGKPQICGIFKGIPNNVTIFDRGRNRSLRDVLVLEGFSKSLACNQIIAAIRLHYYLLPDSKGSHNVSDGQIKDFLIRNEEEFQTVLSMISSGTSGTKNKNVNIKIAVLALPLFYALKSKVSDAETLYCFVKCVRTGYVDNPTQNAAIVYRNDLINKVIDASGPPDVRIKSVYKAEKAIYDFVQGKDRRVSYNSWNKPIFSKDPLCVNS